MSSNLVPRASFPLASGQKTRALGATILGVCHRYRLRNELDGQNSVISIDLLFPNCCSQSSHFPTAGQGDQRSGNKIVCHQEHWAIQGSNRSW